jgi:choline kinase
MLDVRGKSLLERHVHTLTVSGIQDVAVVAGYKR